VNVSVIQTGRQLGVPQRFELDSEHLSEQGAAELARRTDAVTPVPEPERQHCGELGYSVAIDDDAAGGVGQIASSPLPVTTSTVASRCSSPVAIDRMARATPPGSSGAGNRFM
jgi:hypothetical protein